MNVQGTSAIERPRKADGKRSLRTMQKEETLQLLLKSAKYLFIRRGYANTTIDDIASRAGASRATFYLHFPKKCHALSHIVEQEIFPEALEYYRRLDALGIPTYEDIRAWLFSSLDYFERHDKILDIYRQAKSIEPVIGHHSMQFLRRCVDAMPEYLRRWGHEREAYAKLRLNMLTIQLDDAATWVIRDDPALNKELVVEALLEYWMVGLRAPPN